jgi:methionyl-tRNA synthetase
MFLPDRFIKGDLPALRRADQYGDSCEVCGATYAPTDLKNPSRRSPAPSRSRRNRSTISSSSPTSGPCCANGPAPAICSRSRQQARRVVQGWPEGLGHLARRALFRLRDSGRAGRQVFLRLAGRADRLHGQLQESVRANRPGFRRLLGTRAADTELYHFIGKDIIYFHALFWPAMLPAPASARRRRSTRTASSPSTARRCPSRAAPSSRRAPIWTT